MNREPSIADALERTLEAGQALVERRIDLLVAESKLFARNGGIVVLGCVIALIGWTHLVHGVIDGLASSYPRFALELAVGLAHFGVAVPLLLRARGHSDE
jgi:hypothetical protein